MKLERCASRISSSSRTKSKRSSLKRGVIDMRGGEFAGGGNALPESVKVTKGSREREGRIFSDQRGGKARDVPDEVRGEGIKESG